MLNNRKKQSTDPNSCTCLRKTGIYNMVCLGYWFSDCLNFKNAFRFIFLTTEMEIICGIKLTLSAWKTWSFIIATSYLQDVYDQ
jgi:hypothetical protein